MKKARVLGHMVGPRLPGVVLAVAMAGHGLLGYVHLAAVPHVRCIGYEGLRHLSARADGTSAVEGRGRDLAVRATSAPSWFAKDSCAISVIMSQPAQLAADPVVSRLQAARSATATYAASRAWVHPGYRTAPKQSPPV